MFQYRSWLTQIGVATSHPMAFVIVGIYVAVWLIFFQQYRSDDNMLA